MTTSITNSRQKKNTTYAPQNRTLRRAGTILAVPALCVAMAGCATTDKEPAADEPAAVTVTETAPAETGSATPASAATPTTGNENQQSSAGSARPDQVTAKIDGKPVTFSPVKCQHKTHDGRPKIDFDAGDDGSDDELDIDLLRDPLEIEEFEMKYQGKEYEETKQQRSAAKITQDGDSYRIQMELTRDHTDHAVPVDVTITCRG